MDRKLLVIDTEEFDRNMMGRIFGSTYSIAFAANGEESRSVMKEFVPGVVYFELRQADTAQFSRVFDAMVENCPHSALIVAVTENTREFERFIRSHNVFYFMLRPFNLKELWDAVESGFKAAENNMNNM
jgi:DNA-binding NtrC family response regulator